METNEKYRGQTDSIILFILSKSVRHADELKIIIDEYFAGVKIGTLYSIIARLKTQNLISEYRASSIDGSRRKYFKLTDKGIKYFNEKYAHLFENSNIEFDKKDYLVSEVDVADGTKTQTNNEVEVEKPINTKETIISAEDEEVNVSTSNSSISDYLNMINSSVLDNDYNAEIDFSSLENENKTEVCSEVSNEVSNEVEPNLYKETIIEETVTTKSDFIPYDVDLSSTPNNNDSEVNLDSVLNSNYEYTSLLSKLFPKKEKEIEPEIEEIETQDITEDVVIKEFSENGADWNEVYDLAEKEGIKIRTSSDTNRYQGSKILLSKLLIFSSLITLGFALIEYLLLTALIPNVKFSGQSFLVITSIFGSVSLLLLINFLVNPNMQVKNLPKFINVLEIALIITISTAIIAFSISAIKEIDYLNNQSLFDSIILPIVLAFDTIIFTVITYLLSKSEHFESL